MNNMEKISLAIAMIALLAVGAMEAVNQANAPTGQHQVEIAKVTANAAASGGQNLTVEFEKDRPPTAVAAK